MNTDINNVSDKQLFERLFEISVDWLRKEKRRDFYQKVVEFCAALLESEVCALFVKTTQIDNIPRVCLVAGKLPPGHHKGQRMDPNEVGSNPKDHSYKIGEISKNESGQPIYDGVTGEIATLGKPVKTGDYDHISKNPSHAGKWDLYVWPKGGFKCMLGVPIRVAQKGIIGVIKVENKKSGQYDDNDKKLLEHIGNSLSGSLLELIEEKRELNPEINECEYRVPRSTPNSFEKKQTGEVTIKHSMTAICRSDLYYFSHKKSREKLDERLPLVLGHETTGEVYEVVGEKKYNDGIIIQPKDKVVIIPLIPCETCEICKGKGGKKYGENYCPSSRFMASNAPGSLRTIYKYYPDLILKIKKPEFEKYALFTEPMSNVVQMLDELGFEEGKNSVTVNMAPFKTQEFTYFHVPKDSFSNIFDSITAEEPYPRTLFLLKNPHNSPLESYKIRHNNIMTKGLSLLGIPPENTTQQLTKKIPNPKILILGGGVEGYILAVLLSNIFKIKKERLIITGRDPVRLNKFKKLGTVKSTRLYHVKYDTYDYDSGIIDDLTNEGEPDKYDIVFECVGQPATEQNIDLALNVLKPGGVIGMLGLDDRSIKINFKTILEKNIFIKGFYRGSLSSYRKSLNYIEETEKIRENLESLIDTIAEVNKQQGFHSIKNEDDLTKLFCAAKDKCSFGRLVINNLF